MSLNRYRVDRLSLQSTMTSCLPKHNKTNGDQALVSRAGRGREKLANITIHGKRRSSVTYPAASSIALPELILTACPTQCVESFRSDSAAAADATLCFPMRDLVCSTCRCRLLNSTRSSSTMSSRPETREDGTFL